MGHFAVFDLTESGEKIGRKLFALLTKTQQKELECFISESKNSESDSVLSPCYPAFYGQYSIPRQSDQPLTEIQEGDLYFCLEQRLVTGGMCDMLTDQNYATVEAALTAGTMPTDSRSIVIDYNVVKKNEDMGVGSMVEISFGEGQPSVSVTISGLYAPAKAYSGHGRMHLDGATLFAPEALFHELHPEITSFDYSWSIVNDPKKTDYVGAELKNIVASHSNIALDEINTVIEYEEMTNSFAFGSMEVLSWMVFLFGVINLINTTLSNQIARKRENSILRSIGLTQKQLCKMNICEGLCYALFATLATLIVGLPASIFACRKMSIGAFAGNVVPYKFPVLEMGLFILVLFGMEIILSVWTIRRQKKQSLIEQMRAME